MGTPSGSMPPVVGSSSIISGRGSGAGSEPLAKAGIFVRLGARTPGGAYGSAHSPTFYCDNACIPVGMLTIIGLAADYLDFEV